MSNKKVVPMTKETKPETIIVTHAQIEAILSSQSMVSTIRKALPIKQAYWLARSLDKMRQVYKIYKESQQEIIQEHAQLDDAKKPVADEKGLIKWKPEHEAAAGEALKELGDIEVDLGINRIELNIDDPGQQFSIEDMLLLLPLIKEL
jgi:ABC-type sugar transport system ATPase subunit